MDIYSHEYKALATTRQVATALKQLPDDHALRELIAAIERDHQQLLRQLSAGGYARLALPGRV